MQDVAAAWGWVVEDVLPIFHLVNRELYGEQLKLRMGGKGSEQGRNLAVA